MANHGSKFVSVNLNKSYGQQHHSSHHTHYPHFNGGAVPYGPGAAVRGRAGSGGAGGMLVLSRGRGAPPKVAPKLSVPSPLNLPSLRKEHEKFDISGTGGSGAGTGTASGSRPNSSGMGWTKPVAAVTPLLEKNENVVDTPKADGTNSTPGASRVIGSYMPPSARSSAAAVVGPASADRDIPSSVDKAVLLRGEDFPSLQAARPISSGTSQKQKDGLNQKQKQVVRDEILGQLPDIHQVGRASGDTIESRSVGNVRKGHRVASEQMNDQIEGQENYFKDPLPVVCTNPRSDWADDERDTGHGFVEQGRDIGYSNSESYWDRDFDLPRPRILPHKPGPNQYDNRWGQRDNETGKRFSSEVLKVGPYNKDARAPSREGKEVNKWRNSTLSVDGYSSHETVDVGLRMSGYNNMTKENKYVQPYYGDIGRDGSVVHNRDSSSGRRDSILVGHHQQKNNTMESFNNRGTEHNYRRVTEQSYRYRGDTFQSINVSKSSFGKMPHVTDPILNMGRDKRFSDSDKLFSEDLFSRDYGPAGFDDRDLFSEELVGVIKRKKDAVKSTDFHDPFRESFEAELERVQKMQELERQRIIEEQERALEQARREEEDRQRRIREEDEQRRKVEEEAREAAWRAEQERVEAIRKAEEQRIAREEEKRRIQLEEERRKLAAKQKLEELEARIAKRQAESSKGDTFISKTTVDEKLEAAVKERQISRNLDLDSWEDGERIVENVMASGSFDSSTHSAHVEMSSRPYPPREGSSNFADRGKANNNSWKRDGLENGAGFPAQLSDQDTGHYSPRRDAFAGGVRATPQKGFHDGAGYMHSRAYLRPSTQEPYTDDFGYHEDHHRWNLSGNPDSYGKFREMDSESHDSIADRYGDSGWGHGRSRIITRLPERLYPHSEANDLYNHGRSRYSMRQPRVLPPPSLASSQRPNPRVTGELADPSTFLDNNNQFTHGARTESTAYYDSNQGGLLKPSEIFGLQQENNTSEGQNLNNASRCDSQSSLSVSSPPTSPQHFSLDELDESGDSRVTSSVAGKRDLLTGSESVAHNGNSGIDAVAMVSDNVSAVEDEEWTVENDNTMQQQEEYDEDEDGYKEEDEVRERGYEHLEPTQNFGSLELEEGESPHTRENVVLGFDEGVEVVLPNDDFEKKLENQEKSFEIPEISVGIMAERGTVDGFPSDDLNYLPVDDSHGTNADSSSADVPQKLAVQGCIGPVTTAGSSDGTGLAAQQTTSSTATTSQTNNDLPTLSSSVSQGDLPVKLQFGLFSGPSLIPSPVPAIQIGSIQMPLHIHPPVGQSITHMHSSQPPMFQFGQLHYMSPISQGILPMAPQSMSFLHQPNMLGHFNLISNAGGSVTHDYSRENVTKNEVPFIPINNQLSFNSASPEQSGVSGPFDEKTESTSAPEKKEQHPAASRSYLPSSKAKASESQSHHVQSTMQSIGEDKNYTGVRRLGPLSGGGRGRRFAYAVKNTNTRSSVQDYDTSTDSYVFQRRPRRTVQRTEFRVRDRRLPPVSNNASLDDRSNYNGKAVGVFTRSGSKRGKISNRIVKPRIESETTVSGDVTSQEVSGDRAAKEMSKDLSFKSQSTSQPAEANLWRITSEEDVDATLQSGVVRVFKQPGIEAPSDDDDFIEVRSRRQMLNDRREQREKEIKARSRTTKPPRKPHASRAMEVVSRSHNKLAIPLGSEQAKSSQLNFTVYESPHFANNEVSTGCTTAAPQPPIGTPPINSGAHAIKSNQGGSVSIVSNEGTLRETGLNIDSKNKVMSLSQSQIDEAMKPARYDSNIPTVGGHSSTVSAPILPMPSILTKDKSFSSGSSPISSLLAGEKIQFGAVTSPTIFPTNSRIVSHGIGAPGSNRPDPQTSCNFPISEKGDSLFFSKEEQPTDHVEDSEAEAEAAASAVAVAAISSDDMVRNGNDAKSFSACIKGSITGVVGDQHLASQSQSEELLSVSLPADLSVETTPLSLWPPLSSPQSSSNQMLSHFPAGPPSHFPFYEMNPLLGPPIFAFSPQEESSGAQSHPPKHTPPTSGPLGSWQQCHSGVDSFYGAPAGYSGPFIGPPGGIPGVQGPTPHMVVYNHFAPIGQYGQVGLSFMGATYIPSGKQGDWKNSVPTSSSGVRSGEGDINNVNMSNVQRSGPNMTAPIQHLAPGSPLLPMPPPMPMFDVSPFQTAADLPVQARWGHIPASPLHPVPVSRPPQPQIEGALSSQVNHVHPADQSLTANRFTESQTPTQSDTNISSVTTISLDTNVAPFPSQLGLSDSLGSTTVSSGQNVAVQISSGNANFESGKSNAAENSKPQNTSSLKTRYSRRNVSSTQQGYNNNNNNNNNTNSGYGYQRSAGMSYRSMGNEFPHRRIDYRGRNQSGGVDRGYQSLKVKQIYVAKKSTSGGSST